MIASISSGWIGLIGALGGVVVTGVFGLATAMLNRHWQRHAAHDERKHSQNETRAALQREAYARLFSAVGALINFAHSRATPVSKNDDLDRRMNEIREEAPEVFDEATAAIAAAELVAGLAVFLVIQEYDDKMTERIALAFTGTSVDTEDVERRLIAAMRAEQTGTSALRA